MKDQETGQLESEQLAAYKDEQTLHCVSQRLLKCFEAQCGGSGGGHLDSASQIGQVGKEVGREWG